MLKGSFAGPGHCCAKEILRLTLKKIIDLVLLSIFCMSLLLFFTLSCMRNKTFSLISPPLNVELFSMTIMGMKRGSPPATKSLMLEFVSSTQAAPGCCCRKRPKGGSQSLQLDVAYLVQ